MRKLLIAAALMVATPAMAGDLAVGNAQVQHLTMGGTITNAGASGLTAAGTGLSSALTLTAQDNFVATVASGTGVALPNAPLYTPIRVCNDGANALAAYPFSTSDQIGTASTGAASTVATTTCGLFERNVASHWDRVQ